MFLFKNKLYGSANFGVVVGTIMVISNLSLQVELNNEMF